MSAVLPVLTLIAGLIAQDPYSKKSTDPRTHSSINRKGKCSQARRNCLVVWSYLKQPSMYKPLIFIFLVVVAPGITDAMFYFQTDVLGFDPATFAIINVISSISSIVGVWLYRVAFRGCSLRKYLVWVTLAYSVI